MTTRPTTGERVPLGRPGRWLTVDVIELTRILLGRKRTAGSDIWCITSGRTNTTPANAPIDAAVLRKITANPKDIRDKSETNRPVRKTARNAPGEPSVADGAPPPERMASPMKKVRKLRSSQKMTVAAAAIPIFVASRTRRLGVAASVVRIVPLEYSLETN